MPALSVMPLGLMGNQRRGQEFTPYKQELNYTPDRLMSIQTDPSPLNLSVPPQPQKQISPIVKNYVAKKYGKKSPDLSADLDEISEFTKNKKPTQEVPTKQNLPIEEIQEKPEESNFNYLPRIMATIGAGLSSYGAGLQGRGSEGINRQLSDQFEYFTRKEKERDFNNPKSSESIHARSLAKKLWGDSYNVDNNLTAAQFKEASPVMSELYDRTFKTKQIDKADKRYKSEQEYKKWLDSQNLSRKDKEFEYSKWMDAQRLGLQRQAMDQRGERQASGGRGEKSEGTEDYKAVKRDAAQQKKLDEYRENLDALSESINMRSNIEKFNRGQLGKVTPDFLLSAEDKALRNALERASTAQAKMIAGPGVFQIAEKHLYEPLVANPNMSREVAEKTLNKVVVDGTKKAISGLNRDLKMNNIGFDDFVKIREDYDKSLNNFGYRLDANDNIVPMRK